MEIASQIDISKALSLPGWMSERELVWLATQAQDCKFIVEFGSYCGRSTRALADNSSSNTVIYAVDPWDGKYFTDDGRELMDVNTYVMPLFLENLSDHINSGKVHPRRMFSKSFTSFLIDMIFIDGDHRYNTVVSDIHAGLSMLRPGGIISGHDYGHPVWPGVKKAVDEILGITEKEDTIWWTRKSY